MRYVSSSCDEDNDTDEDESEEDDDAEESEEEESSNDEETKMTEEEGINGMPSRNSPAAIGVSAGARERFTAAEASRQPSTGSWDLKVKLLITPPRQSTSHLFRPLHAPSPPLSRPLYPEADVAFNPSASD